MSSSELTLKTFYDLLDEDNFKEANDLFRGDYSEKHNTQLAALITDRSQILELARKQPKATFFTIAAYFITDFPKTVLPLFDNLVHIIELTQISSDTSAYLIREMGQKQVTTIFNSAATVIALAKAHSADNYKEHSNVNITTYAARVLIEKYPETIVPLFTSAENITTLTRICPPAAFSLLSRIFNFAEDRPETYPKPSDVFTTAKSIIALAEANRLSKTHTVAEKLIRLNAETFQDGCIDFNSLFSKAEDIIALAKVSPQAAYALLQKGMSEEKLSELFETNESRAALHEAFEGTWYDTNNYLEQFVPRPAATTLSF